METSEQRTKIHSPVSNPSRGSQWARWDLHVHTPSSVIQHFGNSENEETWEKYLSALEALPPDIKALGINDYFLLDGYQRVVTAKNSGRLQNIELILPVVELRLANFAGHEDLRRINYHVVFSNELEVEDIQAFFLMKLTIEYKLDNGSAWRGTVCHRKGLEALGKAIKESTPHPKRSKDSDIKVGFNNVAFTHEAVIEALNQTLFHGLTMTAVGLAEWDQMRWDGGGAAIKKDVINRADLVFTASPSPEQYKKRRNQLLQQEVNTKLLDCSDAHYYSDSEQPNKLGSTFTWLKADLTFRGLRRAVQCFEDRVFIGGLGIEPPKLRRVRENNSKYIRGIEIRKKEGTSLEEVWFDCYLPLNVDMVAVIGDQGNGKSALTDIIALCGNTHASDFSFLNTDKFRDKQNKAKSFEAVLYWEDGTMSSRTLDEAVKDTDYERVRYVPQGFFEAVTNETVVQTGGKFYGEIKKAIFSHIDSSDQLGFSDFDKLFDFRTSEISRNISQLRQELSRVNSRIWELQEECSPKAKERLEKEIKQKKDEIAAYKATMPDKLEEPIESAIKNSEIDSLRSQEKGVQAEFDRVSHDLTTEKRRQVFLKNKQQAIVNERQQIEAFVKGLQDDFGQAGLDLDANEIIKVTIDLQSIEKALEDADRKIEGFNQQLNVDEPSSFARQLRELREQRERLEKELEQASQTYQIYKQKLSDWERGLEDLQRGAGNTGSLESLERRWEEIATTQLVKLKSLEQERCEIATSLHQQLRQLASVYQELTLPVQEHIKANPLTRDKYGIEFAISLVEQNVAELLFGLVTQSAGSFSGVQEGRALLTEIVEKYDFSEPDNAIAFVEEVLDKLSKNYKHSPATPFDLQKNLRQGRRPTELYDMLFGLEYVVPQYSLKLNGRPLRQLSPGERGILLLVFYLIVDRGDVPLIIDQPEGNLNNQSIFSNLVPVFMEAKKRRQVIVVTHNPNLAVVSDAEQIIHAQIHRDDGNRVLFDSGSLENPIFGKLSLDVLDGTPPAFTARRETYEMI